jgi:hypothetical protein
MAEEEVVAEIGRGPAQKIVVRKTAFRGKSYVDIRHFFRTEAGEWLPTKRGIAVPWELREALVEAIHRAGELDQGSETARPAA